MGDFSAYDVFHSRYYAGATYAGDFEMPVIHGTDQIPSKVIRFSDSKSKSRNDSNAWIIPYEHDIKLRPFWRNAFKYLDEMLDHPGIISWDFSMYRNMPFALQYWNCFRGRLLGSLYERYGGTCIPNIRPSDIRSLKYSLDGLPTEATVSMGTLGAIKTSEDRTAFRMYVEAVVKRLKLKNIMIYGSAPESVFYPALEAGTHLVVFQTQTSRAHHEEAA